MPIRIGKRPNGQGRGYNSVARGPRDELNKLDEIDQQAQGGASAATTMNTPDPDAAEVKPREGKYPQSRPRYKNYRFIDEKAGVDHR